MTGSLCWRKHPSNKWLVYYYLLVLLLVVFSSSSTSRAAADASGAAAAGGGVESVTPREKVDDLDDILVEASSIASLRNLQDDTATATEDLVLDNNTTIVEEEEEATIVDGSEEATTVLSEIENDDGTTTIANWTFVVTTSPTGFCTPDAIYCIPVSKFQHLPVFHHQHEDGGQVEEASEALQEEWKQQIKNECTRIHIFLPGLSDAIAQALVERHTEFQNEPLLVITAGGNGIDVSMFAIGTVVSDVSEVNYLNGHFTVDLRVYIYKVTHGAPYTSMTRALDKVWKPKNRSSVVRTTFEGHEQLLDDEYVSVLKNDPDQIPDGGMLFKDGRCSQQAMQSLEPVPLEEYNGLKGGLELLRGATGFVTLNPVVDENNDILYLKAIGAKIKFQPVNSGFFPFQVNILDIQIGTPPSRFALGERVNLYGFCVAGSYTGFKYPIPSLPNNGELTLIPTVHSIQNSPWFNDGNQQMHLDSTAYVTDEDNLSEKAHQAANFRIVYADKSALNSWMILLPFLFTAFTTQLQWLTTKPHTCNASSMITSVLLIQNLVNSQSQFTGYHSIATEVIYMTYGVCGVYVTAVALMTFINLSKEAGKQEFLGDHQEMIFRYLRLAGLLLTPLYIPILAIQSNDKTGEQHKIHWVWPLIASLVIAIFLGRILLDVRQAGQAKALAAQKETDDIENLTNLSKQTISSYSPEDVRHWITHSQHLAEACQYYTHEELTSIANKFFEAKIDGNALLRTASDPKMLVQFVGLPIGQAIGFSDAFNTVVKGGSIKVDPTAAMAMMGNNAIPEHAKLEDAVAAGTKQANKTTTASAKDDRSYYEKTEDKGLSSEDHA